MEQENEVLEDFSNTSEFTDSQPVEEESFFDSEEEEVDYKAKYEAEAEARKKAEEVARNQKIRAEKAEKLERKPKDEPQEKQNLSTRDVLALVQANVPSDDIDEVVEYARFKNIPVTEALKAPAVKAILAEKQENRTVAEASNTGTVKRGSSKISDEALLAKASKGELPDSDDDLKRLIRLKKGIK